MVSEFWQLMLGVDSFVLFGVARDFLKVLIHSGLSALLFWFLKFLRPKELNWGVVVRVSQRDLRLRRAMPSIKKKRSAGQGVWLWVAARQAQL